MSTLVEFKKRKDRLVLVGGSLTAVFTAGAGITSLPILAPYIRHEVTWIQAGLALLGLIILGIGLVLPGPKRGWSTFHCRPLAASELLLIHQKVAEYAGGYLVPIDRKMAIHNVNPGCFSALEEVSPGGLTRSIVGFIMIYPVNLETARKMMAGQSHGAHVMADDVVKPQGRAAAIYVAFMWGADRWSRASTIKHVQALIDKTPKQSPFRVITRPTTREALRTVTRRGFRPLSAASTLGLGQVCYFES
jgi:hypothetical protein